MGVNGFNLPTKQRNRVAKSFLRDKIESSHLISVSVMNVADVAFHHHPIIVHCSLMTRRGGILNKEN